MAGSARKKEIADEQKRIIVQVFPYRGHSVCTIGLGYRDAGGVHDARLAYWHLRLTRADLAGHGTDDVIRAIVLALVRHLDSPDPADRTAVGDAATRPQASAPLEGPQGEEIPQTALPGL